MGQIGASLDSVFLKDVFEDDLHVHLVMELCEGGSILDRLKDGEYSERQVRWRQRNGVPVRGYKERCREQQVTVDRLRDGCSPLKGIPVHAVWRSLLCSHVRCANPTLVA